jgi:hypothetical protein
VENLCKNTARVIRPFSLGALRETRGVEKKTGWEEQSSKYNQALLAQALINIGLGLARQLDFGLAHHYK